VITLYVMLISKQITTKAMEKGGCEYLIAKLLVELGPLVL
jgi:hypothetical protein